MTDAPSRLTIGIWADNTIGGTEKAATLFAVGLAALGHRVIYLGPPGPRDVTLAQGNVPRLQPPADPPGLAKFLQEHGIEIIHQHLTGFEESTLVFDALKLMGDSRPRLIETNVFGADPVLRAPIDFRCYVSRTNAVQSFQRLGRALTPAVVETCTVTFNPLLPPVDLAATIARREQTRLDLGVAPDEILLLRFGREGGKWCDDEVIAFRLARRRNPQLRLLLMEPAKSIWADVEAGKWGEGIILRKAISDFTLLAAYYAAGDLMLHMSAFGESYGYTIAEAMQYALPVVVKSTPWRDNAQVELVEHGVTGYVCACPEGGAGAVLRLASDPDLRRQFGAAARERIVGLSSLEMETRLIEEIMQHLAHGQPLREVAARNRDLLNFGDGFAARENCLWELNASPASPIYWHGVWHLLYRTFRTKLFDLKRKLKR